MIFNKCFYQTIGKCAIPCQLYLASKNQDLTFNTSISKRNIGMNDAIIKPIR